jgi:Zn ribbon nucleic-acid-binding protein
MFIYATCVKCGYHGHISTWRQEGISDIVCPKCAYQKSVTVVTIKKKSEKK